MDKKINIIMCVYNAEQFLNETVQSILSQTYREYEFFILDDNSTDKSYEILKYFERNDDRIKLYKNNKNIGITRSLNRILNHTTSDYIIRMDADDIAYPNWIEELYSNISTIDNISMVSSDYEVIDEEGKVVSRSDNPGEYELLKEGLLSINMLLSTSIFRKKYLKEIGCFRNDIKYAQDYDLNLRMSEKWRVINIKKILFKYRSHKKSISSTCTAERDKIVLKIRNDALKRISENKRAAAPLPIISQEFKKKFGKWKIAYYFNYFGLYYIKHKFFKLAKRQFLISMKILPNNPKTYYYLFFYLPIKRVAGIVWK